jgi:hypothetical protein
MKHLIILLAFFLISQVHAGTCTSISRTNSASLSVLTSTKYNTDLNTVYTASNAFDGGCITSGTLESDALNTTQFAPLLKGLTQGCKVIYSNASTVQIDKCIASVNGNFVTTTTTTNASFGCSGCSAEAASTTYYVYIQTGSTGSTLTPLILTTAPNNDGYDNSGNKVLARFYNGGTSDIISYKIDQWEVNKFQDRPRLIGSAYYLGTSNCVWPRTSTTVGAFTADTDCPAPTVEYEIGGDFQTDDVNLPRFTIKQMTPGYYKVTATVPTEMSSAAASVLAISDGTTTCKGTRANDNTQSASITFSCIFYYTAPADRYFEIYGGSSASEIRITTNQSVTEFGLRLIVEYLGAE